MGPTARGGGITSQDYRFKTLKAICWLATFVILSIAVLRLYYFNLFNFNVATLLGLGLFPIALIALLNRGLSLSKAALALNIFLLLALPVRIAQNGGLYSPVWYLYAFHCVFVFSIYGKWKGVALLVWCCLSLGFFALANHYNYLEPLAFYNQVFNYSYVAIVCVFASTFPVFLLMQEKNEIEKRLLQIERQTVSSGIALELSSAADEELPLAKGALERLERGEADESALEASLRRLNDLVKDLSIKVDEQEVDEQEVDEQEEDNEK